ncbi:hypothetical protein NST07_17535 [Paenibacillus sp. FSL L8-0340]|uniref:hypothetical protein n=1 Tax=Paenibacillus sp. FSL L8-0340 TaxID=2954685 RepID=UPI0031580662
MKAVLDSQRNHVVIKKRNTFWFRIKRDAILYALLLLPLSYIAIFIYAPIYGLIMAFQDYNIFAGIGGSEWVGLDVFRFIFQQDSFYRALKNTLVLNVLDLIAGFPAFLTICAAYPLTKKRLWGRNFILSALVFTMDFSGGLIPS